MLEQSDIVSDKPKITRPKPAIASKPKYVPPVNLKVVPKSDLRMPANGREHKRLEESTPRNQISLPKDIDTCDMRPPELMRHQSYTTQGTSIKITTVRARNGHEEFKITKPSDVSKKVDKMHSGAPNSPSTVCCSILSNTSDCCNIMGNKKDIDSKTITKIDSLDSNSSDSGGFRDFVQIEAVKKMPFEPEPIKIDRKYDGHVRNFSQPEFLEKSVAERAKTISQNFSDRKSTEHVYRNEPEELRKPPRQSLLQHLPPMYHEKTEEPKNLSKIKSQLIAHGQFVQSTKKLEEMLSQRLDKDKQRHRRGASCHDVDSSNQGQFDQQMIIQKEFQQKLQADLKQTVKHIQEIQSIELRLPQNRSWDEVRNFILKNLLYCK